ncbi:hypothetical protein ACF3NT_06010 [Naumannella halotolerans]|uniref:Cobalamin-independent methionine synthase catalytic subunit n=1 Tax=Naumannella halotolerans TaxID=993414 RepID=A0A4V6Q2D9_9ACTN|nr:hypothetical protein [Naumannella halotolerans]TDT33598.1 cobalamin-independent methionine synthase catalytic subunit [Naumannella halotolerans]
MRPRWGQLGSLPGEDFAAASRMALSETPDPTHVPELPDRGAPAEMIGRTTAVLAELGLDLQPSGWRIAGGSGIDHRRARTLLRNDLEIFEEAAQGFTGEALISFAGPWTMAASVELPRGNKLLSDAGARRDLAQSLTAGIAELLAELARRLPQVRWRLQLDEPMLPAVLTGAVPTASGYDRYRAVPEPDAAQVLQELFAAMAPVSTMVHCCAPRFPWAALAGADAVALDAGRLTAADLDRVAGWLETGKELQLGIADTSVPDRLPSVDGLVGRTLELLRPLELGAVATRELVLTPACGLATWSPAVAAELLRRLARSCGPVAEELSR